MNCSVTEWLDATEKQYPEKMAIVSKDYSYSYRELKKNAMGIAATVIATGTVKKPIAVFLKKDARVIVSFMGIAYSGNFYTPIDVNMPDNRIKKILEILKPEIVICDSETSDRIKDLDSTIKVLFYGEIINKDGAESSIETVKERIIDTDLLYVLFTSGSTGVPKGVGISHRSVIDYIDCITEMFRISCNDSFGNQAPFYFDNSILDIYCSIKTGATLFIVPSELFSQPYLLLKYLDENKINTIFWVPSALIMVSKIKALQKVNLSGVLKRVLFCGEVMPTKQLNIWRRYLPNAVYANLYGPTEITDACTAYIVDRDFDDEEPLPIGKPMKNTEIIVLDQDNRRVDVTDTESVGELCVRGTSLAVGYYNNQEKTDLAFVQNPLNTSYPEKIYRTGDVVKYNRYGELIYICRKDFQIKHMGHRIELGEIETAISSLEDIPMCCCLYDEQKKRIIAFVEGDHDRHEINEKLRRIIPDYMIPGKLICLESFPLNQNGKIDRPKLRLEYIGE